jgi:hypothetical protein
MHLISPPRMSNSSEGTFAPHLTHSYAILSDVFSKLFPLPTEESHSAFKHFQPRAFYLAE